MLKIDKMPVNLLKAFALLSNGEQKIIKANKTESINNDKLTNPKTFFCLIMFISVIETAQLIAIALEISKILKGTPSKILTLKIARISIKHERASVESEIIIKTFFVLLNSIYFPPFPLLFNLKSYYNDIINFY